MSRGFLFLWGTQLVSLLGSSMTAFGISLWVYETTQSPFYILLGGVLSKSVSLVVLFAFAGALEVVIGIVGYVLLRGSMKSM